MTVKRNQTRTANSTVSTSLTMQMEISIEETSRTASVKGGDGYVLTTEEIMKDYSRTRSLKVP